MTRLESISRAIYEARRKASAFTLTPYDALPPDVRAMQETFAQAAIDVAPAYWASWHEDQMMGRRG